MLRQSDDGKLDFKAKISFVHCCQSCTVNAELSASPYKSTKYRA